MIEHKLKEAAKIDRKKAGRRISIDSNQYVPFYLQLDLSVAVYAGL
jgi:hypothetical protein